MQRSVELLFRTSAVVTDITGNIPAMCKASLPYAQAERTILREGTLVSQSYSHFLFFIEVIDVDLYTDLEAGYIIKETSLFLFMMLEGQLGFTVPNSDMRMEVSSGSCHATYNREGVFGFSMPKGKHRLCYIVPRTEWIIKNIQHYPRLQPFLDSMKNGDSLYGHLPTCTITQGMEIALDKLFGRYEKKGKDLEAVLLRDAKRVMKLYQKLLDQKLKQRVHLIKDYIDQNYANPDLNNAHLMKVFHITEKTLIETFKAEFGDTPYNYLIRLRVEKARQMLQKREKSPLQASILVGYTNFRSFSAQFKKIHGISPLEYYRQNS